MGNNNGLVLLLLAIGALYVVSGPSGTKLVTPTGGVPLVTYIPTSNISTVWRAETAEPVILDIAKQKLFRKTATGKRPLVVSKYELR